MTALNNAAFPKGPDDHYALMMKRVQNSGSDSNRRALLALSWVFHAKRPLQSKELCEAVIIESKHTDLDRTSLSYLNADQIIKYCKSFLVYHPNSEEFRFFHDTAREYFKIFIESDHKAIQDLSKFDNSGITPRVQLSKICLTYLDFQAFGADFVYTFDQRNELVRQLLTIHAFRYYAARFWADHVRDIEHFALRNLSPFKFLASRNKRNSMLLISSCDDYVEGKTILHIAARNGLVTLCKLLLRSLQDARYEPSM